MTKLLLSPGHRRSASCLFQVVDDGACELIGCSVAAEILCADLSSFQRKINGVVNLETVVSQVDVTQHLGCAQKHRRWVGDILAGGFAECVTRSLEMLSIKISQFPLERINTHRFINDMFS